MVVNEFKSKIFGIASGVRQGLHLGPLLCNMVINDISECLYDLKFSRIIESSVDVS